jgi:hypothetical protein
MRLISNNGKKAHVIHSGSYYVVSDNGRETLIFKSDKTGRILSYSEVGGAIGTTLTEVIGDFHSFLYPF